MQAAVGAVGSWSDTSCSQDGTVETRENGLIAQVEGPARKEDRLGGLEGCGDGVGGEKAIVWCLVRGVKPGVSRVVWLAVNLVVLRAFCAGRRQLRSANAIDAKFDTASRLQRRCDGFGSVRDGRG